MFLRLVLPVVLLLLLLLLLLSAACGSSGSDVGASGGVDRGYYELLTSSLSDVPSFHMTLDYEGGSEEARAAVDGTFEVDAQPPDRYRGVRFVSGREVSRSLVLGSSVFTSEDMGASWSEIPVPDADLPHQDLLAKLAETPCEIEGTERKLTVILPSRVQGCGRGVPLTVTTSDGRISSLVLNLSPEPEAVAVRISFDYSRTVAEISIPAGASDG